MRAKLTIKHHFDAAHQLPGHPGQCKNLHGHRWEVEVTVEGEIDPDTGMVVDFGDVKKEIDKLDHCCINEVEGIPMMPTAENLAHYLLEAIPKCVKIKLWESPECSVEVEAE